MMEGPIINDICIAKVQHEMSRIYSPSMWYLTLHGVRVRLKWTQS